MVSVVCGYRRRLLDKAYVKNIVPKYKYLKQVASKATSVGKPRISTPIPLARHVSSLMSRSRSRWVDHMTVWVDHCVCLTDCLTVCLTDYTG